MVRRRRESRRFPLRASELRSAAEEPVMTARWEQIREASERGLYRPQTEHDACGVGFVANIKGIRSHSIVEQALQVLVNLEHRGAVGCDPLTSDGAGILFQIPFSF